jgi:hypothetical protein
MVAPITIDLTGLQSQFGLDANTVNQLTEVCIQAVSAAVLANWTALAKRELGSTREEYIQNLNKVDVGRFAKQIVLTGVLPNMLEQGASPFDIKQGFKKSPKARHTIAKYNKKGQVISPGGQWYLTVPFRIGVPGTLGQAGFSGQMPTEIYDLMKKRATGVALDRSEIPSPYDVPRSRAAIAATPTTPYYAKYVHKTSLYDGLTKRTAQYGKTTQNTYGTFRRASENSDPLSWIHKGLVARNLAERAVQITDVDTIVENEVTDFLDAVL